ADRSMAEGTAPRLGRSFVERAEPERERPLRCWGDPGEVARARARIERLAVPVVGHPHVESLARAMDGKAANIPRRARRRFGVNADWFFVSHRMALARACAEAGFEVAVCAGETDRRAEIERAGLRFIPLTIDRGGTRPLKDLGTIAELTRVYVRERPDVVHHV